MLRWAGLIFMLLAPAALAQEAVEEGPEIDGLMQSLPEKTLKKLRGAPEAFLEDAAGLIHGYGTDGGIDEAGIAVFVAADRARLRAREMARYQVADLDNDGDVTHDEIVVLANAAAAGKRGALRLGFDLADADRDGVLRLAELRDYAQAAAMKAVSDDDAEALRGFMVFDLDGDGVATMDEVRAGVSAMIDGI